FNRPPKKFCSVRQNLLPRAANGRGAMQRLFTLGMLCIVVSSGSGCCLLDRIFHSCGERYYNGPPGCQAVPHALCASDHAKCEPCDQYGNWIGTPQWHRPGYQTVGYAEGPGYYQGELLYDGVPGEVIYERSPTP